VRLRTLIAAAAVALTGAMMTAAPASAATINGQLDVGGVVNVQSSNFEPGGNLDFDQGNIMNEVVIATGDFATFVSPGDAATLFDLAFSAPEDVYTVGGFTFRATSYFDFDNAFPGRSFAANGVLTGNGFDATQGLLTLSTQSNNAGQTVASFSSTTTTNVIPLPASVLMLLAALGGLGIVSRRRAA
jgi:hypothetical protein